MNYYLQIDVDAINGEGIRLPSNEISFTQKFKLNRSCWSFKEEALPGTDFTNFYNSFKKGLPSGIDSEYKIVKHEYGAYCDSPSFIDVKIILHPSSAYLMERYLKYYSSDFENKLKANHHSELETMYSKFDSYCYVRSHGICIPDDDTDRCILSFASLGLKPLNLPYQLYTLSKVLTDHLNDVEGWKKYFVCAGVSYTYGDKKNTLYFNVRERPVKQPINNDLKDW